MKGSAKPARPDSIEFPDSLTSKYTLSALRGAWSILFSLGQLVRSENVCIVSDDTTKNVGTLFADLAEEAGIAQTHVTIPRFSAHGEEPPPETAHTMASSKLVLGLTSFSMAHTAARQECSRRGVRYLSLPEYSLELLEHPALRIDFKKSAAEAKKIADALTSGARARVVSPGGTDIELTFKDRQGNFCPGYVNEICLLGSPPDIEANVSPDETGSNGRVVVDGSIPYPGFGRLDSPVILEVRQGLITKIEGAARYTDPLNRLFDKYGSKARTLAEFGIGFNEAAELCGNMLIDEGCRGTFHFGFGSNSTVGGKNQVNFHLDCIFYATEFFLDGAHIKL